MIQTDLKQFGGELRHELENILDYWSHNCVDHRFGGFVGKRNFYNEQIEGATKGVVLNARILWSYSAAYNFGGNPRNLELAHRAYEYLINHFWDKKNGGLYWELCEDGSLLNGRKQIYAQGFGIYGFSEYYKATANPEALKYAVKLFELIEKYSFDTVNGGYLEALSQEWEPLDDMRLSEKDANEPKSMNTHLHILEPYTNLLRVYPDAELKAKTEGLIRVFLDRILDRRTNHLNLFFGNDWSLRSSIVSYGHDIEAAWLLSEAAHVTGNRQLIVEVDRVAVQVVDAVLAEGTAPDGSIFNERNLADNHLDTDRHWWPQAEAMVGLVYAAHISGEAGYLEKAVKIWHFIQSKMVDKQNGEWFWRVDINGLAHTGEDKAGFWKCPYHNSRAMMEVCSVIEKLS